MRTFTVTHIYRTYTTLSNNYGESLIGNNFYRWVPFWTPVEDGGYLFHVVPGKTQYVSEAEMQTLVAEKKAIVLPEPKEIPSDKRLIFAIMQSIYVVDAYKPNYEEKIYFCHLTGVGKHYEFHVEEKNMTEIVEGKTITYQRYLPTPGSDRQYEDILVITHIIIPYEGYPTEENEIRELTFISTTLTEEPEKHRSFGKDRKMYCREEIFNRLQSENRLQPLEKPILYEKDKGCWTDKDKNIHFGEVPKEAKRRFAVYLGLFSKKSHPGYLQRVQMYTADTMYLDTYQTVHMAGSETNSFDSLEASIKAGKGIIKPPFLIRLPPNMMTWSDTNGNVYLAKSQKPSEGPITLLFHSKEIEALPLDKHVSTMDPMPTNV